MKKIFLSLCLALLVCSCSYQRFEVAGTKPSTVPTYEGTTHFVFWGIGQSKEIDPNEVCGVRGVNSVESYDSFLNGLFSVITWGIYSPRNYAIYCNR